MSLVTTYIREKGVHCLLVVVAVRFFLDDLSEGRAGKHLLYMISQLRFVAIETGKDMKLEYKFK